MPHSRVLSEVVVQGLPYNQAWLEADDAAVYVKFILEGEKASTPPGKALPGLSVVLPGDLIFEQEHYLTSDLRVSTLRAGLMRGVVHDAFATQSHVLVRVGLYFAVCT